MAPSNERLGSTPKPPIPEITLVPWDPDSDTHAKRIHLQRIACGWKMDAVESWRQLQRDGRINVWWIVLGKQSPESRAMEEKHVRQFPGQSEPLSDTAKSFGGKPRQPVTDQPFHPIGHISLDLYAEEEDLANPAESMFCITKFYISSALQGGGLGRRAMDMVEEIATGEPLRAKVLTLDTLAEEYIEDENIWRAIGQQKGFPTQKWYTRRGYKVFKREENRYGVRDEEGNLIYTEAVFMKKQIQ